MSTTMWIELGLMLLLVLWTRWGEKILDQTPLADHESDLVVWPGSWASNLWWGVVISILITEFCGACRVVSQLAGWTPWD